MKKGWYKKAKIKFIDKEIYSYELTKRGTMGSDYTEVRYNQIRTVYFGSVQADWQYDMRNIRGFAERFIWAQELERKQPNEFYFTYKLKKNLKY